MMLSIELKIVAKVLVDHLQVILDHLISPEQICNLKSLTIQDNLHLVHMIIEKIDGEGTWINSDQSKAIVS